MQASTPLPQQAMRGRNFPEKALVGHLPTADLVAGVLRQERASYGQARRVDGAAEHTGAGARPGCRYFFCLRHCNSPSLVRRQHDAGPG